MHGRVGELQTAMSHSLAGRLKSEGECSLQSAINYTKDPNQPSYPFVRRVEFCWLSAAVAGGLECSCSCFVLAGLEASHSGNADENCHDDEAEDLMGGVEMFGLVPRY